MVKSIIAIVVSALVIGFSAFFEWMIVSKNFESFHEELVYLSQKLEDETANEEDAKVVQTAWERRKKHLNAWIPHNNVTLIDEYMAETVGLIEQKEYTLASAKIGTMLHLTKCLPDTYMPHLENIF